MKNWATKTNLLAVLGGVFLAVSGFAALDVQGVLPFLPEGWGKVLTGAGIVAAGSIQAIRKIGDLLDDGILNDSWNPGKPGKFPCIMFGLLALGLSFGMVSCNSAGLVMLPPTADGCFPLQRSSADGVKQYAAGPCIDGSGKIDRIYTAWSNDDGVAFVSRFWLKSKRLEIKYEASPGLWLTYDSAKGGIRLDLPPGVNLDGSKPPVAPDPALPPVGAEAVP